MTLEIKDLAGLSQPMTKLIEVVSAAVGTLYRPRCIRSEADAKAYEIRVLERAKFEAEIEGRDGHLTATQNRISSIAREHPELADRARLRLLNREIEGQINVEEIAEQAALILPPTVSSEPIGTDWRRKFFQKAENVCEPDMQVLWGKVLAGEISQPGSFSLRTLETMTQLSRREAELFRLICGLAMDDGSVALPGFDINTALKPFGFGYDEILQLRDAGLLLHGDSIHKTFPLPAPDIQAAAHKVVLRNNEIFIELSGPVLATFQLPSLIFTQSGRELRRLIENKPNDTYLALLGTSIRQRGIVAKRGNLVPQNETTSLLVFEQDL